MREIEILFIPVIRWYLSIILPMIGPSVIVATLAHRPFRAVTSNESLLMVTK